MSAELEELEYLRLKKKKAMALHAADGGSPEDFQSVGQNAISDLKDIGKQVLSATAIPKKMLIDDPIQNAKSLAQVVQGVPLTETPSGKGMMEAVNSMARIPKDFIDRTVEIGTDFRGALRRHPIKTPLDIASVAIPAVEFGRSALSKAIAIADSTLPSVVSKADQLVPKAVGMALSTPEEALKYRMRNRAAVESAAPYSQLADELPKAVEKLGNKLTAQTKAAKGNLRNTPYLMEGAVPKDDILSIIKGQKRGLAVKGSIVGGPQGEAAAALDELGQKVSKIRGETVSEKDVRKIVESLDPKLWGEHPEATQIRMRGVRVRLDQLVKKQNTAFREQMVPVAKNTRLIKNIQKEFALKNVPGEGSVATPATTSKFENLLKDRNTIYQRRLSDLAKEIGVDFNQKAKDYSVKKQFMGGETNGSRNTLGLGTIGAAIGGFLFGPEGATIGGAGGGFLGRIVDKRGREMAAKMMDAYMRIRPDATLEEFLSLPTVQKEIPALANLSKVALEEKVRR